MSESQSLPTPSAAEEKESSTETATKETPPSEASVAGCSSTETPTAKEMRAIVLTGFGGMKNVKILKRQAPVAQENEILIRVKSCGLNFPDVMTRMGVNDSPAKTPFIMGMECAGEVEAIGDKVQRFKVGDRVLALSEYGSWAEYMTVHEDYAFLLPEGMEFQEAVALTLNYIVAYMLLFNIGRIEQGNKILFHSAGGGVGQAIVQLSKTVEDITLIGVCSRQKHDILKNSIDHLIDRTTDYAAQTRRISPEGVDLFLDCLGAEDCSRGYNLLKPRGHYILYGSAAIVTGETRSIFHQAKVWWQVDKISPVKIYEDNKSISGLNIIQLIYAQKCPHIVRKVLENIMKLWSEKKIKPVIDSVWAFEDITEAMQKMQDRSNIGKLIIDPTLEPKPKPATPSKSKNKSVDKDDES